MAAIIRVTLRYVLSDQDFLNSFWWVGDNAVLADAQDLAVNYSGILGNAFETFWHNELDLMGSTINMWDATPGSPLLPGIPYTVPVSAGTVNANSLPQGTSLLLNFKAYGISPNRKRLYIGGFTNNHNIGGLPHADLVAAGNDAIDDLLATQTVNTHDYLPAVVRLNGDGAYVSHHVLDSGFVSANWARLSSRRSR